MIYTILGSFCSFFNCEGADIRPLTRPRKILHGFFQNELHTFATRQEAVYPNQPTALRACTLDAAVSLINDPDLLKDRETSDASDEKIKKAMFKCGKLVLGTDEQNILTIPPDKSA